MTIAGMEAVFDGLDVEYARLRNDRGLIDLRGAGLFEVSGPEAVDFLDHVCTRSPAFLVEGRTLSALMLDQAGGVVSEVLVACDGERWTLEVWPQQREAAAAHLTARSEGRDVVVRDLSGEVAIFGVEGPRSLQTVQPLLFFDGPLTDLAYKHFAVTEWRDAPLVVSRTGFTAEFGYELRTTRALGDELRTHLISLGALPCGSDALNVCRLESRFVNIEDESPRPGCTPFELSLQWLVDFNHEFLGKEALLESWRSGALREPVCFVCRGDAAPRPGDAVVAGGVEVGRVAHVAWSPARGAGIGVAHLDGELAAAGLDLVARGPEGEEVAITTRSAPFLVPRSLEIKQL